jgi:hypothetical protein
MPDLGKGLLTRVGAGVAERGALNAALAGTSDYATQNALSQAGVQTNPDYLGNMLTSGIIGAVAGLPGDLRGGHVEVTKAAITPDAAQDAALKATLPSNPSEPHPRRSPIIHSAYRVMIKRGSRSRRLLWKVMVIGDGGAVRRTSRQGRSRWVPGRRLGMGDPPLKPLTTQLTHSTSTIRATI